jgi:hypothetical protein
MGSSRLQVASSVSILTICFAVGVATDVVTAEPGGGKIRSGKADAPSDQLTWRATGLRAHPGSDARATPGSAAGSGLTGLGGDQGEVDVASPRELLPEHHG